MATGAAALFFGGNDARLSALPPAQAGQDQEPQQDFYYRVALKDLKFETPPPGFEAGAAANTSIRFHEELTHIVLDQLGEAWCASNAANEWERDLREADMAVHVHQPGDISGTLYLAMDGREKDNAFRFTLPVQGLTQQPRGFQELKAKWYGQLLQKDIPGAAWFRMQREAALLAAGKDAQDVAETRFRRRSFDDTFEIFSGGRAISENLQLDRQLMVAGDEDQTFDVPIDEITGITIQEFDWTELNAGVEPKLDTLAAFIPHDQHAIFFPSFSAMMRLIDKSDEYGTMLMFSMEPRSEDAQTKDRYQKQLCLEANQLSRLLGPSIIRSVAVTGSDPYLRTGSDVAILFDAEHPTTLWTYVRTKHTAAQQADPRVKPVSGELNGIAYEGVTSPDRTICSYVARSGDIIIVTNSLVQIERLAALRTHKETPLRDLPEYAFMRNRYPLDSNNETAFVMISDATIRRWCGPKWRIANSRRTRAAAQLAQLTAEFQDRMLENANLLEQLEPSGGLGRVLATGSGLRSPIHNTLNFMTPIAESDLTRVTANERDAYVRWRTGYERNWRTYFDPIAAQISITDDVLSGDLTVMPLIANTDYQMVFRYLQGAKLLPTGADRHDEAVAQIAIPITKQIRGLAAMFFIDGTRVREGGTVTVFLDRDDDFLTRVEEMGNINDLAMINPPVCLRIDISPKTSAGSNAALESLAAALIGKAPTKRDYRGYTVFVSKNDRDFLESAVIEAAALFATNSKTMNAAIDRELARIDGKPTPTTKPEWAGESFGFQIDQRGWWLLEATLRHEAAKLIQQQSWTNLPILNEWKARYPDRDPVEVHEEIWGTKLLCPAGGEYVWNDEIHSMVSTAAGHPSQPKLPDMDKISPLSGFRLGNFGLTLTRDGLRARGELHIAKPESKEQ